MCRNNNIRGVKFLLDHNVDTLAQGVTETALHVAAENNYLEIVRLLLEKAPGLINCLKDKTTRLTALHLAAESGHSGIKNFLITIN